MTQAELPPPPDAPVLQDWTPLGACLDWQIGQAAFQLRGAQAFTTQEVPNLINQGGMGAYRAAEVLFAHCAELDAQGALEPEIWVMELAVGLGLHAVQLLDRFQALCADQGRNYYDRLTFFATDGTPRMVEDAQRQGVFDRHAGRVVLGLCDALDPAHLQRLDTGETLDLTGRLRAVLHTYLLCVLPANLFRRVRREADDGTVQVEWSVVMARTVLRHADDLPRFSQLELGQVLALAQSPNALDRLPLAPLYPLVDLDLALASITPADHAEGAELERIADALAACGFVEEAWVLHSAGAMRSLQRTLEILRQDGFVLYRDYGPATAARANGNHLYQHYGTTTATGINHFALDSWATDVAGARISAPDGEGEASIKNRLLSRAALPATRAAFALQFDPSAFEALEQAIAAAREALGGQGDAIEAYRHALQLERDNWVLLGEAGEVALRHARQAELAQLLLTEALRINPWYSAAIWAHLGDLRWATGEIDAAEEAYRRAVQANPEHHRAYLALAELNRARGKDVAALEFAAQALARDQDGADRERTRALLEGLMQRLQDQNERAAVLRRERQAGSPR